MKTISVLFLLGLGLSGCYFGPPSEYRYYVLDYVPDGSSTHLDKEPWPASVLVRNFPIGEAYLRSEMVYRTSPQEIRYRPLDRWAVRPDHVVSDMVRKHLLAAHLFRSVQSQYEENKPEYELKGRVVSLEEDVVGSLHFAHLDLRLDFVRMSDNAVLWGRDFDERKAISGDDRPLVVAALSGLLESSMDTAIAALDTVMKTETLVR
jgi:ABC-type uncharacterized transport system auxiliary subunit